MCDAAVGGWDEDVLKQDCVKRISSYPTTAHPNKQYVSCHIPMCAYFVSACTCNLSDSQSHLSAARSRYISVPCSETPAPMPQVY